MKHDLIFGICISTLLFGFVLGCNPSAPSSPFKPPQATLQAILRATPPVEADYSYLSKIDSHLQSLLLAYVSGGDVTQAAQASGLHVNDKREVLLDIYVTNPVAEAAPQFESMGMVVQATNGTSRVVEGLLPVDALIPVARLAITKSLLAVTAFGTNDIPYPNPYPNP